MVKTQVLGRLALVNPVSGGTVRDARYIVRGGDFMAGATERCRQSNGGSGFQCKVVVTEANLH